jgi:hypothetical protein
MTRNDTKTLLEDAAGENGREDDGWRQEGVERLYFADPRNINTAGFVEVRPGDGENVRLELFVPPDLAADVITMVTKSTTWGVATQAAQVAELLADGPGLTTDL